MAARAVSAPQPLSPFDAAFSRAEDGESAASTALLDIRRHSKDAGARPKAERGFRNSPIGGPGSIKSGAHMSAAHSNIEKMADTPEQNGTQILMQAFVRHGLPDALGLSGQPYRIAAYFGVSLQLAIRYVMTDECISWCNPGVCVLHCGEMMQMQPTTGMGAAGGMTAMVPSAVEPLTARDHPSRSRNRSRRGPCRCCC